MGNCRPWTLIRNGPKVVESNLRKCRTLIHSTRKTYGRRLKNLASYYIGDSKITMTLISARPRILRLTILKIAALIASAPCRDVVDAKDEGRQSLTDEYVDKGHKIFNA